MRVFVVLPAMLLGIALVAPVFVIATLLWGFASAARLLTRCLEPRAVAWHALMRFDRTVGWKPQANLDAHYLANGGDVYHIVTDDEGWPGQTSLEESRLVVLGDSFAYGYGIDIEDFFGQINPRLPTKTIGAPGYNMVQTLLLMRQLGVRLREKLVVWFIYLENDLYDNLMPAVHTYRAPFVRSRDGGQNWEIVTTHLNASPWDCSSPQRPPFHMLPAFCIPGALSSRIYSASKYLIREGYHTCATAGANLAVVTIPCRAQLTANGLALLARLSGKADSFHPDLPDHELGTYCSQLGVPFVPGRKWLRASDYNRYEEVHWNKQGHRRMAELLERLYDQLQLDKAGHAGSRRSDEETTALGIATLRT